MASKDPGAVSPIIDPFRLGDCLVFPEAGRIERKGEAISIEPRMMDVLTYLAAQPDVVVTRQELEDAIWTGTVVGYKALTNTIIKLRKALSDDAHEPHIIKTIPKRGYQLVANVNPLTAMHQKESVTPGSEHKPTLTVEPFDNIGSEADSERLGDTFSTGIVVALTRVSGLVLVDFESPTANDVKRVPVPEMARRFAVRYLLKGTVQKLGSQLRLTTELVETSNGTIIWAERLDRELRDYGDFFATQDEIVDQVVTALDVKLLSGEAARVVRRAFKSPAALEHYCRGEDKLWCAASTREFREAQRLFEETIRLESDSPVGYAGGALAYWTSALSDHAEDPTKLIDRAVTLARQAISLDDVTGYAHMVLAHVHLNRREFEEAASAAERAVVDRPSCPTAYAIKAKVLTYLGRANEAIDYAQHALRLTPLHPTLYADALASAYYNCSRYKDAAAAARDSIELAGSDVSSYVVLSAALAALGRDQEARDVAGKVGEIEPDFSLARYARTQPYKDPVVLRQIIAHLKSAGLR